jgi:hypothetical protein
VAGLARSMGVPIVTTMRDDGMIGEPMASWIAEPGNPASLAAAILACLSSPARDGRTEAPPSPNWKDLVKTIRSVAGLDAQGSTL